MMKSLILAVVTLLLMACTKQSTTKDCEDSKTCMDKEQVEFELQHKAQFTAAMKATLGDLLLKKSNGEEDQKKLKAFEILAMTDAAKSYAFTQIYAVSAEYCGGEVKSSLKNYKDNAAAIITLGAYYYSHGISATLDDRDFSQTGEELTAGLNEMLEKLKQEHLSANEQQLKSKCKEARSALGSLAYLYGNN